MGKIPNEIYLATYKELMSICSKLVEVKDYKSTEGKLFNYMSEGLRNKGIFSFISYGKDRKMNGFSVLITRKVFFVGLVLCGFYVWTDEHYPILWKDYMDLTENFAKEFKIKNYYLFRIILQGRRFWNKVIHQ